MKSLILFIATVGLLSGCSSLVRQPYDPNTLYEMAIRLTVTALDANGKQAWKGSQDGLMAVPRAVSYKIEGEAKGDFDYLIWQTCGRQKHLEKQGDNFSITWTPDEVERSCGDLLEIKGFEEKKRRNSGAMIIVENKARFGMPGTLTCNGDVINGLGTSACQMKQGLKALIRFPVKAFVRAESPECAKTGLGPQPDPSGDTDTYLFKIPSMRCNYVFGKSDDPKQRHRLFLSPYSDVRVTREGD